MGGKPEGGFHRIPNRSAGERDCARSLGKGKAAPSEHLYSVKGMQPEAEGLLRPVREGLTRVGKGEASATQPAIKDAVDVTGGVLNPPLPRIERAQGVLRPTTGSPLQLPPSMPSGKGDLIPWAHG